MARTWYGSVQNRIEEDRMFCDKIEVGTGMTEYDWSDRHAYEVVAVKDQKHITVRKYDHIHKGDGHMDNNWELVSNPENPEYDMVKVGKYWYWTVTITASDLDAMEDECEILQLCVSGFDTEKIRKNGKQTRRKRAKVSFGVASYYYDYEF